VAAGKAHQSHVRHRGHAAGRQDAQGRAALGAPVPDHEALWYAKPGFVIQMLAALSVRYPTVPIHFCQTRALAEEWTYRFLAAAIAHTRATIPES
jgi:hypothetical protein